MARGVFNNADVAQRAAGRALFGEIAIGGRIPVTVPGAVKRGDGLARGGESDDACGRQPEMESELKPAWKCSRALWRTARFPAACWPWAIAANWRARLRQTEL